MARGSRWSFPVAVVTTAILTAVVTAAIPALGHTGSRARLTPPPPVVRVGSKAGPVALPPNPGQIAQMSIPKGTWVITAKLWIENDSATSVQTKCTLKAGTDTDATQVMLETATGDNQAFQLPFALAVAHTFASAGAVKLLCPGFASPMNAKNIRIVALKAGTLTRLAM
jgi:hypothetical protein